MGKTCGSPYAWFVYNRSNFGAFLKDPKLFLHF